MKRTMLLHDHRHSIRGGWATLWIVLFLALTSTAFGQVETKLNASDGSADDVFGMAVTLQNDRAIVGAFRGDNGGFSSGAAYVFHRRGTRWVEEAKLAASDGETNERFGIAVALDGDYALVGASRDDEVAFMGGATYVFRLDGDTWVEDAQLTASDAAENARFGSAVAIQGNRAVITASQDDDHGPASGSAYVFEREDTVWVEKAKLTASDGAENDRFGRSMSLSGDRILVGAYLNDDEGSRSGSAYVFRFNGSTWEQEAKLTADDATAGDNFGYSVSLDGDYALIGAYGDRSESGSAYIFHFNGSGWEQQAKIRARDASPYDNFGVAVALSGDGALVGAWANADAGLVTGSAYLFRRDGTTWEQETKILGADVTAGDGFGIAVALDGEGMLIGAYGDDDRGSSSGSAYLIEPPVSVAAEDAADVPAAFHLEQNYPNPFNPETVIAFDLPQTAHTRVVVYDMMSREVARLVDAPLNAGTHSVTWNAENMPSGVYMYRLEAGAFTQTQTMVLLR